MSRTSFLSYGKSCVKERRKKGQIKRNFVLTSVGKRRPTLTEKKNVTSRNLVVTVIIFHRDRTGPFGQTVLLTENQVGPGRPPD